MKTLYTQQDIEIETKILAKRISDKHKGEKTPIVMVGLLNGCFMFYSDFVRNLTVDVECDFIRVKSYEGQFKQGDIKIIKDLETPIKGKHVYLVDDIYDTGTTMKTLIEYLEVKKPKSITLTTLVKRETSPTPEVEAYHLFTVNKQDWLVGYGMDNEHGLLRNYPGIYSI